MRNPFSVLRGSRETPTSVVGMQSDTVPVTQVDVYVMMRYCPLCGSELEEFLLEVKRCPHGHGRARPTENSDGLPAIIFDIGEDEPREMEKPGARPHPLKDIDFL